MSADERIIALIDKAYMDRIPSFIKRHVTGRTCKVIARDYPELYESFSQDREPGEEEKERMRALVNGIVAARLESHCH